MSPVISALGLAYAYFALAARAAPSSPSKAFDAQVESAEKAVEEEEFVVGAVGYEVAYERLSAEQRATATGTAVVFASVRARRAAFARGLSNSEALRAAKVLLDRHRTALSTGTGQVSTSDIDRELTEIRTLLAAAEKQEAAAQPGPWYVMMHGVVAGPLAKDAIAESYLDGTIDDATLIHVSDKGEWVPLAQSPIFPALDLWYLGRDAQWLGPMNRATLIAKVREAEATGFDSRLLYVRLAWSEHETVPYRNVSRMLERPATAPVVSPPPIREDQHALREAEREARDDRRSGRRRAAADHDNGRALATVTPRIGIALPGPMTPEAVQDTKLGVGFPFQIDAVFAPIQSLELGSYLHYSVRKIKQRGDEDITDQVAHLVSAGAVVRAKIPTSRRSRMRLGLYFGYNYERQQFDGDIFGVAVKGNIVGRGVNIGPSIEWSIDVARAVAFNFQVAGISQVWGVADGRELGDLDPSETEVSFAFAPLAFLAAGLDFHIGQRK